MKPRNLSSTFCCCFGGLMRKMLWANCCVVENINKVVDCTVYNVSTVYVNRINEFGYPCKEFYVFFLQEIKKGISGNWNLISFHFEIQNHIFNFVSLSNPEKVNKDVTRSTMMLFLLGWFVHWALTFHIGDHNVLLEALAPAWFSWPVSIYNQQNKWLWW